LAKLAQLESNELNESVELFNRSDAESDELVSSLAASASARIPARSM
jgi:hypothetical protein